MVVAADDANVAAGDVATLRDRTHDADRHEVVPADYCRRPIGLVE
jgi:hypothetical protein